MSEILRLASPSTSPTRPNFNYDSDDDDADGASQKSISLSSPATSIAPSSRDQTFPYHKDPFTDSPSTSTFRATGAAVEHLAQASSAERVPTSPATRLAEHKVPPLGDSVAATSILATSPTSSAKTNGVGASYDMDGLSLNSANTARSTTTSFIGSSSTPSPTSPDGNDHALNSIIKYPPRRVTIDSETASMTSFASGSSKKARPESKLLEPPPGLLIPGIALVDFNHLVGPKLEFTDGDVFEDEEIIKLLPFLALPDGAHMTVEDYTYFHIVPSSPNPTTLFGISCNRQIKASELLAKDADVTRSTVQKSVVVLASKPMFGAIRDKLGVVTQALFNQRDFRSTDILVEFRKSLEASLRTQLTESVFYMGTSIRELIHKFRHRTLLLLKTLMLQKRIMFYGHPVERLCTYQYSLVSMLPGLLQNVDDCGSPPLANRAATLKPPNSLKSSDRKSLMAYLGLPLDLFGKDAFFQPYLPLQQVDMIKETRSWLCGTTNSIVTQQKEVDLLVNIETITFEFRNPKLERLVSLTAADRKWMDDILKDVMDTWNKDDPSSPLHMQFRGSDDYLRGKFEEYITSALASVKYTDYLTNTGKQDTLTASPDNGDANALYDFNTLWITEFKQTNAYDVWNRVTDPMLFDLVDARHPCAGKPNPIADIGLRISEGIQDLKLDQQLAPTRDAISRTVTAGSTSLFNAMQGVRERWTARSASSQSLPQSEDGSTVSRPLSTPPVEVDKSELPPDAIDLVKVPPASTPTSPTKQAQQLATAATQTATEVTKTLSTWGTGIGSFFASRTGRFSVARTPSETSGPRPLTLAPPSARPASAPIPATKRTSGEAKAGPVPVPVPEEVTWQPKDLGEYPDPSNSMSLPEPRPSQESFVGTAM